VLPVGEKICQNQYFKVTMLIQCRDAIIDDLPFIHSLFIDCMNRGHFVEQPNQLMHAMLKQMIEKGFMLRRVERQTGDIQTEQVGIWMTTVLADNELAGFLVTAPESAEHPERVEIYQIAISEKFQRIGVATALLKFEEKQHKPKTPFFARCYVNSTGAITLLQNNGFRIEQVLTNSGTHYLRKP
jgi:ribosomal protein S18 acetylase RimI-like enzyme